MTDPLEQKAREIVTEFQRRTGMVIVTCAMMREELEPLILTALKSVATSPICADCKTPLSHDHEGYWCEPCHCKAVEEYNAMQKSRDEAAAELEKQIAHTGTVCDRLAYVASERDEALARVAELEKLLSQPTLLATAARLKQNEGKQWSTLTVGGPATGGANTEQIKP